MINNTTLVGRVTKDPELRMTQSNIAVARFTLAVNRQFTDQSGDRQADFIQCIVWRKQAENLVKYVKKGHLIGVVGRIQTSSFESDGQMRYQTEVVCDQITFLESKKDDEITPQDFVVEGINDKEDDLPFWPNYLTHYFILLSY